MTKSTAHLNILPAPEFPLAEALRDGTFRQYNKLLLDKEVRGNYAHGYAAMLSLLSLVTDYSHEGNWLGKIRPRLYITSVGRTGTYKSQQSDPVLKIWRRYSREGERYGLLEGYCTDAGFMKKCSKFQAKPIYGHFDEQQSLMKSTMIKGSALTHYLSHVYTSSI